MARTRASTASYGRRRMDRARFRQTLVAMRRRSDAGRPSSSRSPWRSSWTNTSCIASIAAFSSRSNATHLRRTIGPYVRYCAATSTLTYPPHQRTPAGGRAVTRTPRMSRLARTGADAETRSAAAMRSPPRRAPPFPARKVPRRRLRPPSGIRPVSPGGERRGDPGSPSLPRHRPVSRAGFPSGDGVFGVVPSALGRGARDAGASASRRPTWSLRPLRSSRAVTFVRASDSSAARRCSLVGRVRERRRGRAIPDVWTDGPAEVRCVAARRKRGDGRDARRVRPAAAPRRPARRGSPGVAPPPHRDQRLPEPRPVHPAPPVRRRGRARPRHRRASPAGGELARAPSPARRVPVGAPLDPDARGAPPRGRPHARGGRARGRALGIGSPEAAARAARPARGARRRQSWRMRRTACPGTCSSSPAAASSSRYPGTLSVSFAMTVSFERLEPDAQPAQPLPDSRYREPDLARDLLEREAVHVVEHRERPGRAELRPERVAQVKAREPARLRPDLPGDGKDARVHGVVRAAPDGPGAVQADVGRDAEEERRRATLVEPVAVAQQL